MLISEITSSITVYKELCLIFDISTAFKELTSNSSITGILLFILYVLVYVAILLGVVYTETAERRINVQYANKSNTSFGGRQNYIPFKLNSSGVMPVIFSSALISIPSFIASFIKKSDKHADIENTGRFIINNKAYYIFVSYHNYAFGYDGVNSRWKDIVVTFWEDMGQYAVLKDYSYLDNGGILQKCSSQNNMIMFDLIYGDERAAYGNNFYTYILDNDKFYLYSYKNITGIDDKNVTCTYYTYTAENKKPLQDITLDYLKSLRDTAYSSKKCSKLVGIE